MEKAAKRWKGKDWYDILAPKQFNEKKIGEIPTTDPKSLVGRTLHVSVGELVGQTQKYYGKLKFKITDVNGKSTHTRFDGYSVVREYLYRAVRKRLQKVDHVVDVETQDNWKLQVTSMCILNGNTKTSIQNKVRLMMDKYLKEFATKSTMEGFVNSVIMGLIQKDIKDQGSKVYPVRFNEILKIEVMKAPA